MNQFSKLFVWVLDIASMMILQKNYGPFGYQRLFAATGYAEIYKSHCADVIFAADSEAAWGCIGDEKHKTTREGEHYPEDHCRRNSLGTMMRNWHPAPMMFQVIADSLAYQVLLAALDVFAAASKDNAVTELRAQKMFLRIFFKILVMRANFGDFGILVSTSKF